VIRNVGTGRQECENRKNKTYTSETSIAVDSAKIQTPQKSGYKNV